MGRRELHDHGSPFLCSLRDVLIGCLPRSLSRAGGCRVAPRRPRMSPRSRLGRTGGTARDQARRQHHPVRMQPPALQPDCEYTMPGKRRPGIRTTGLFPPGTNSSISMRSMEPSNRSRAAINKIAPQMATRPPLGRSTIDLWSDRSDGRAGAAIALPRDENAEDRNELPSMRLRSGLSTVGV